MNCLIFALRFWEKNPEYRIWYNLDHCINIPTWIVNPFNGSSGSPMFHPAEDFGYDYFVKWDHALIEECDKELLKKYFNI